ncbi:MAG: radical SAM protein [Bacteroidales bacterium]|jgi:radical SAM superfamily enzyme YgiQ (UPF0313 family)|nr:radical SAM protein [Bacteroidales bacterium]MDD4058347.1 radical SAM protein [Bacteroidales bacterium]
MKEHRKLLFISANRLADPYPVYPIGISYLQTYLNERSPWLQTDICDMNLTDIEGLKRRLIEYTPDYVGISFRNIDGANSLDRTSFIPGYKEIIDAVRASSKAPVIIGGAGFSVYPEILYNLLTPDYGIAGEGEESLRLLLEAIENGNSKDGIEGLISAETGGRVQYPHTKYLSSLNLSFDEKLSDFYWEKSGMLNIQTKRGCCYNCIYCSYPIIDGRKVRTLDTDLIVDTLERLYREKGINYVFFTDSVFNIHNSYNAELAEKIIKSGIKINWGAYFSPHNLTDDLMGLFRKSGLKHIEFGTESFSTEQMHRYGKNFSFDDVLKNSELCLKHNVFYAHFLILGGIGETEKTLAETMENSKKIRYSVFFPYIGMRIYPGTPLQQMAIADGKISPSDNLLAPTYYLSDEFNLEQCRRLAFETGKAWIFPDDPLSDDIERMRVVKKKKGLIWEYLRKP